MQYTNGPLKEVVVYRYPPVFHIYNVVEFGRRWFRTIIFSSDPVLTIHDMGFSTVNINNALITCCGELYM
jgi:hypothetical protein